MPNTYTQLYIHLVFAVKGRENKISSSLKERVEQYLCGIARQNKHKPLAIYCMPNHLHFLVGLNPSQSISDLVRDLKSNSSKFINENKLLNTKFAWQEGFGAFSHSREQLSNVIQYIMNQHEHHKKLTFKDEYFAFLKKYEIEFDEKYLFEWNEE